MSGHSKWHNIAQKKGKSDAARSHIFTKIGREIAVAVKQGGPDPNSNSKLRDAISKAKSNNMPNDNNTRSIKKASGELNSINYEEITYEGYGSFGTAFIVETLTDNRNRTGGDVRHIFDKFGGSMGANGCVSYMFNKKGIILVEKKDCPEDDMLMYALDAGAAPGDLNTVAEKLTTNGIKVASSQIDMIADNYVTLNEEQQKTILKMINMMEEHDDIQNIYHNAILDIEEE